jgi:hypothetical protein
MREMPLGMVLSVVVLYALGEEALGSYYLTACTAAKCKSKCRIPSRRPHG